MTAADLRELVERARRSLALIGEGEWTPQDQLLEECADTLAQECKFRLVQHVNQCGMKAEIAALRRKERDLEQELRATELALRILRNRQR